MGHGTSDEGLPTISICPLCGARLVTRNLCTHAGPSPSKACFQGQSQP